MTKAEFIALLSTNSNLPNGEAKKEEAKKWLDAVINTIDTATTKIISKHQDETTFRKKIGLGDMRVVVKKTAARQGRHPKDGSPCTIPAKIKLSASFGRRFKNMLTKSQNPITPITTTNTEEKKE